jgi:hypothetical protein
MSLYNSTSVGRRASFADSPTPLTAANLQAATVAAGPTGTSQAASRVDQVRGLAAYVPQAPGSPSDVTLQSEDYDEEGPRPAGWYSAINANTGRGTVGAGSLFRPGPTDNLTFEQRRDLWMTRLGSARLKHQQLTGALYSIMGGDLNEASALATRIQSQFQGPVAQSAFSPHPRIPQSILQAAPVTLIVTFDATPEVRKFFQESIYGQSQNTAQLKASAPSPSRVHSSPGSIDSKETIGPGHPEYKAAVQMKPSQSGLKERFRAIRKRMAGSQAPAPTALSRAAPRDSYSELREQLSQILPAQGNAQRGAPSYAPGGQFTLADLAAAQSAAGPSNRTNLMPLNGGTAPTGVHQWLENQGQSCAREYYGPQETMGGSTHGPQPSFVF